MHREESDLEDTDEDLIQEEMTDEHLQVTVSEIVRQIQESSYTVDVALINLKQIKHGYSKDNIDCANSIINAIFTYAGQHQINTAMKAKEKTQLLDEIVAKFCTMMTTFIQNDDDQ